MRIAVTGGAGYIGSVVTEVLLAEGHEVLVIDDLSKGHAESVPDGARFAALDIGNRPDVAVALRDFATEAVIHMAASSLVGESVSEPSKYYAANVVSALSLLDAMAQSGVTRLVFSSTAAVYGEPDKQPIEETDPLQPTNPYGETKLAFERALAWYARAYGLASISLRYFNAAGATERNGERHDPETHLIPLVLQAAAGRRREVAVFGDDYPTADGTCIRDYVHVEDIARAHVRALPALEPGICPGLQPRLRRPRLLGARGDRGGSVGDRARHSRQDGRPAARRSRRTDRQRGTGAAPSGLGAAPPLARDHRRVRVDVDGAPWLVRGCLMKFSVAWTVTARSACLRAIRILPNSGGQP